MKEFTTPELKRLQRYSKKEYELIHKLRWYRGETRPYLDF